MKTVIRIIQVLTGVLLLFLSLGMFVPVHTMTTSIACKVNKNELASQLANEAFVTSWLSTATKQPSTENYLLEYELITTHEQPFAKLQVTNVNSQPLQLKLVAQTYTIDVSLQPEEGRLIIEQHFSGMGVFWQSRHFFDATEKLESTDKRLHQLYGESCAD
ncbi:MAG: hypothetical protein HWE13_08050 [Gammaproteobacteria bacterium]|nr:hypothetical protein [Gammaproteobacteria bacterium]NVK88064.1 hypothetical protein [Gammaproteobacteria bacterium]